jgi:hypothetical protein
VRASPTARQRMDWAVRVASLTEKQFIQRYRMGKGSYHKLVGKLEVLWTKAHSRISQDRYITATIQAKAGSAWCLVLGHVPDALLLQLLRSCPCSSLRRLASTLMAWSAMSLPVAGGR